MPHSNGGRGEGGVNLRSLPPVLGMNVRMGEVEGSAMIRKTNTPCASGVCLPYVPLGECNTSEEKNHGDLSLLSREKK